jgi:hypothetical protein
VVPALCFLNGLNKCMFDKLVGTHALQSHFRHYTTRTKPDLREIEQRAILMNKHVITFQAIKLHQEKSKLD